MSRSMAGLLDTGLDSQTSADDARRIKTINIAALLAFGLNVAVSTVFFVFIDSSGSWLLRCVNLLFICGYAGSFALSVTRRVDAAMWLLAITALLNVLVSSLAMGLGAGSISFFVILPLFAVLASRRNDRVFPSLVTVGALAGLIVVVFIDPAVPQKVAGTGWESILLVVNVASVVLFAMVVAMYYRRRVDEAQADLAAEHERSEALLLDILPNEAANRLKSGQRPIADDADDVAVLFGDLVGSTPLASMLSPDELVHLLDNVFSAFDDLADAHSLEKIKTVGDAYIVVGGLPTPTPGALAAAADMALAMRQQIHDYTVPGFGVLELRLGLHIGPVVAGVIGKRKFSYDIWGDTVNIAARMESAGIPGEIQVTSAVRDRLVDQYDFAERGTIDVKGKGPMETYLLKRRRAPMSP
ncbi:MAG: adenylate/guanylate cyclase domain-containing protein [Acidimicrobiia bacterium]